MKQNTHAIEIVYKRISEIKIPANRRAIDEKERLALAESIDNAGLLINPITITPEDELIAGRTRLGACEYLGWEFIACHVVDVDSLHAELIELDENLRRRELPAIERSKLLARRKTIHEQLYPETAKGKAGAAAKHGTNGTSTKTFTADAAATTGKSQRVIQEEVAIGMRVPDDVADLLRDTPIADNKSELQKLSELPEEEQRETAQRIKSGETTRVETASPPEKRQLLVKEGLKEVGCLSRTLQKLGLFRVHAEMLQEIKNSLVDAGAQG
jgi:ParB family chromosome partitioning protein